MTNRTRPSAALGLIAAVLLTLGAQASAEERIAHHQVKPAETLDQAVDNFAAYNSRLAAILRKKTLDADDIVAIHEITYTLENALARINADLSTLADTLEALHLATEKADLDATLQHGTAYLDTARKVIP